MQDDTLRITSGEQGYRPEKCLERSRNVVHEYMYIHREFLTAYHLTDIHMNTRDEIPSSQCRGGQVLGTSY